MFRYHLCLDGIHVAAETWWKNDGYGIPLALVCDKCEKEKMKSYRSDIESRYDTDETIEEDGW